MYIGYKHFRRDGSDVHAYERIAQTLRAEIEDGTWPAGEPLPQLKLLEERFQSSRITVRGALELLMDEGLVYTGWAKGKRGTIVRRTERTDIAATTALRPRKPNGGDAFTEAAERAGRRPAKRFALRYEVPPTDIADRLGIDRADSVVVRSLYQLLDDEPWSLEISWYPRDLAEEVGLDVPEDLPHGTSRALADAGHQEIAHIDEITDDKADPETSHELAIPIGSPVLIQTRIAATAERVTRVTRYVRHGRRTRVIWELGEEAGLDVIRQQRAGHDA